jgi:DNA polymerase-1
VDLTNVIDTAVMARMNVIPGNLEDACTAMGTNTIPRHMRDVWSEHGVDNSIEMPDDALAIKCCEDVMGTMELYHALSPLVDMDYVRSEMELLPILETMSRRGIRIDQDLRFGLEYIYQKELEQLDFLCQTQFGFNPGSPDQVAYILSKRGNFLPKHRTKGGKWKLKTDEATLEKFMATDPLCGLILRRRHVSKTLGTYLIPYRGHERAYTYFHLDAATARVSSSSYDKRIERNLQNVPGDPEGTGIVSVRNMFIPDNEVFTDTDFSQIELRVLAYVSGDRLMQDILNDPKGDLHQETANFLRVPRKIAKNCTFAIVYGATAQTVMETAHLRDLHLAQRMLDQIFARYPNMGEWIRDTQMWGREHGWVPSLGGRRISVIGPAEVIYPTDDWRTIQTKMAAVDRKSTNYPIQTSAGEIQKKALKVSQEMVVRLRDVPMAHQIHDEIIWDGYAGTPQEIDGWFNGRVAPFPTPTVTKYVERWQ